MSTTGQTRMGFLPLRRRPSDVFPNYRPPPKEPEPPKPDITPEIDALIASAASKEIGGIILGQVPFISLVTNPNKLVSDIVYKITTSQSEFASIVHRNVAIVAKRE